MVPNINGNDGIFLSFFRSPVCPMLLLGARYELTPEGHFKSIFQGKGQLGLRSE